MTNNTKRNTAVVVDTNVDGTPVYLGSLDVDTDVSNGAAVKECKRCGVSRITNALKFSERGAKRIAKGYSNGYTVTVE